LGFLFFRGLATVGIEGNWSIEVGPLFFSCFLCFSPLFLSKPVFGFDESRAFLLFQDGPPPPLPVSFFFFFIPRFMDSIFFGPSVNPFFFPAPIPDTVSRFFSLPLHDFFSKVGFVTLGLASFLLRFNLLPFLVTSLELPCPPPHFDNFAFVVLSM